MVGLDTVELLRAHFVFYTSSFGIRINKIIVSCFVYFFQDMCLPSVAHMLELTLKVVKDVNAKHLFIATDKHPHLEEFRKVLSPIGVRKTFPLPPPLNI